MSSLYRNVYDMVIVFENDVNGIRCIIKELKRKDNLKMKETNSRNKLLIIILSIITVIAVGVTIWALFFRDTNQVSNPDYAPQQVESNAQKAKEDDTKKLDQPKGGGAVSLIYSKEVMLSLSTKEVTLMFQNPSKSNQNMKIEVVIDSKTIVESGRIEPGYKVEKLSKVDTKKLSAGKYDGKFIVSYYNSESGEKAVLNTEIPITITVKD